MLLSQQVGWRACDDDDDDDVDVWRSAPALAASVHACAHGGPTRTARYQLTAGCRRRDEPSQCPCTLEVPKVMLLDRGFNTHTPLKQMDGSGGTKARRGKYASVFAAAKPWQTSAATCIECYMEFIVFALLIWEVRSGHDVGPDERAVGWKGVQYVLKY